MKKISLLLAIVFMCSSVYAAVYTADCASKTSAKDKPTSGVCERETGESKPLDLGEPTSEEESQMEREKHSEEMFDNEEPVLGDPEDGSTRAEQDF